MFGFFAPSRRTEIQPVGSIGESLPCDLLISLCNTRPGGPHLLRLAEDGGVVALSLPGADVRGITGMVRAGGGWVLAVQMPRGGALTRLHDDDSVDALTRVPGLEDAHGLIVHDGDLLAVATGSNSLLRLDAAFHVRQRLTPFGMAGADVHHINDLCLHDGQLIISAFGEKTAHARRDGGMFALRNRAPQRLFSGLNDPHSVTSHDGWLYLLDSRTGDLIRVGPAGHEVVLGIHGYARGLCLTTDHIVVGVSTRRSKSRTRGSPRNARFHNDTANLDAAQTCGLHVIHRATGQGRFVDLSVYGPEIYQIVAG